MKLPALAILTLAASASAQLSLFPLGTVDVSSTSNAANPEYIGSNPSAVAWNGTDLWVAGFNSSGATGDAAIVGISNPLTAPTYGLRFGVQAATPNSRGYSGLDINGGLLAAAYDPGGASPEGITGWDLAGASLWSKDARGGSGVGIDPGFGGVDAGTGWTTFGSGRRALQDNVNGTDIYTTANGMIINSGAGTFWRDMDFDDAFGDIYLRKGNQVHSCIRTGGNSVAVNQQLTSVMQADFVGVQNLAFMRRGSQQVIIWNDRPNTSGGKSIFDVVRAITPLGNELSIEWNGFTAGSSSGAYDFSYDEASGTLAICDFNNRQVHIFAVSVFERYGIGCTAPSGFTPDLNGGGDAAPGGTMTFTVTDAAPLSIGLFAFGSMQTSVPLPFSVGCNLQVAPVLLIAGLFVTPPGIPGSGSGSIAVPAGMSSTGAVLTCQAAILENGDISSTYTSNGVQIVLP